MRKVQQAWRGEERLWRVFWVYGVALSISGFFGSLAVTSYFLAGRGRCESNRLTQLQWFSMEFVVGPIISHWISNG
jgi:hypothetical protein